MLAAESLLRRANNSVELAITLHFNDAAASSSGAAESSTSQLEQLRAVVGSAATEVQLLQLLSQHGSAERAADAFFAEPDALPAQPAAAQAPLHQAGVASGAGPSSSQAAAAAITVSSDSASGSDEHRHERQPTPFHTDDPDLELPELPLLAGSSAAPDPPQTSSFGRCDMHHCLHKVNHACGTKRQSPTCFTEQV